MTSKKYGRRMSTVDYDEQSRFRTNPWDTRKPSRSSKRDSPFIPSKLREDHSPRNNREYCLREKHHAYVTEATYFKDNESSPHSSRIQNPPAGLSQPFPARDRCTAYPNRREKEYKLSDLISDSHLPNIEVSKRRSLREWFKTLPPNVKVDKDVFTERGMLITKDNFRNSGDLDSYLGIENSRSPLDKRWL